MVWVLPEHTDYTNRTLRDAQFLSRGGIVLKVGELAAGELDELLPASTADASTADISKLLTHVNSGDIAKPPS